ncbi:YCF48-related protein [Aestuariibacter sp. AA17]|uniref:YCF48-related protein n=1 Tax=Fluctibacter corallii TaxID=2984329 RepID=A0ABT3A722_9ALTE|nr:YCF48-related protein [Aestuariibacter sp. AA17]MCV2884146.1 YCF48-related protein [Aestuariibacter sp. AA17]
MQQGILLLGFLVSFSTISSEKAYQAPLVTESLLLDIEASEQFVYAVGERGHILRSKNGKDWTQMAVPSQATLTSLTTVNGKAWAVGHDATILHMPSESSGDWEVQMVAPEMQRPLMDIMFFNDNSGIAIGAYGSYFVTDNGGQTWSKKMHPEFLHPDDQAYLEEIKEEDEAFYQQELASILPHLNRITRIGDAIYIAGEAGLLAFSDDNGEKWQRMESNYMGSFFDIEKTADGKLLAAGLRGNAFTYSQQDEDWERVDTQSKASWNSILPLQNENTLLVGNNGQILCIKENEVNLFQTEDGEAVTDAVEFNGEVIGVSVTGLTHLSKQFDFKQCKKVGS